MSSTPDHTLIECLRVREGGSVVPLGGVTYHFTPREGDGAHVAAVAIPEHVERFLDIPAYRIATAIEGVQAPAVPATEPRAPLAPIIPVGVILDPADTTAAPTDPVNADPVTTDEADKDAETIASDALAALDDDELRAEFEKIIGRKAHHKSLRETLIAQIIQARAAG